MARRIRDRVFVGAHAPGSFYWAIAGAALVWALGAAILGSWASAVEGALVATVVIGVIWLLSRALRWPFWPWR